MRTILASGSPRRKQLLEAAGLIFEVILSPAEEIQDAALGMGKLCETNAARKARAIAILHPDAVVIGADTLVFMNGEALGKPRDGREAHQMLRKLSGNVHQVCTGVCIAGPRTRMRTFHEVTEVTFLSLDDAEISHYLGLTNPLDKAGAYGIQDHGDLIVERIEGNFDNVMGLPVARLLLELEENGLLK